MKQLRVLITGGGTGGHLSPGIALYEELKSRGVPVFFLVGKNDAKFTYINEVGEDLYFYGAPPFTTNILKLPFFAIRFAFSAFRARRLMRKLGINTLIGMGGYVSAPALFAARVAKIPYDLCEQNSVPGKVTRFFSKHAHSIFSTFDITRKFLKYTPGFMHVGNPIRRGVFASSGRERAREHYNLKHCDAVVLAIGGSQGALRINELMMGVKSMYSREFKNIGIIWSTGALSFEEYKKRVHERVDAGSVFLSPFISEVGLAYSACDIAVSRSGAGVMMELAAMGVPSILIPYPYAADDHQTLNAKEFHDMGAAIMVANEEAVPEKVGPMIIDLLKNRAVLGKMSEAALAASKKDAAERIADAIERDFNNCMRREAAV